MKPKMTKDEHIALIKDALDAILNARVEYDIYQEEKTRGRPVTFKTTNTTFGRANRGEQWANIVWRMIPVAPKAGGYS